MCLSLLQTGRLTSDERCCRMSALGVVAVCGSALLSAMVKVGAEIMDLQTKSVSWRAEAD